MPINTTSAFPADSCLIFIWQGSCTEFSMSIMKKILMKIKCYTRPKQFYKGKIIALHFKWEHTWEIHKESKQNHALAHRKFKLSCVWNETLNLCQCLRAWVGERDAAGFGVEGQWLWQFLQQSGRHGYCYQ